MKEYTGSKNQTINARVLSYKLIVNLSPDATQLNAIRNTTRNLKLEKFNFLKKHDNSHVIIRIGTSLSKQLLRSISIGLKKWNLRTFLQ